MVNLCDDPNMTKRESRPSARQIPTAYQCAVPVARIQTRMEALHLALDAFTSGATEVLKGQQTRDNLRMSLAAMDTELTGLQQLLSTKSKPDRTGVTGAAQSESAELARKLDEYLTFILNALHPYTSGLTGKPLSKTARSTFNLAWPEIRRNVAKLNEILENVEG